MEDLMEIEIEEVIEEFVSEGDEEVFRSRMRRLGFDPPEIDAYVETINA